MIYDKIENAQKYLGMCKQIDIAMMDMLSEKHLTISEDQKVTRGELEYETVVSGDFETHLKKADIHIVSEGEEKVLYAPVEMLKEFVRAEESDYIGSRGAAIGEVILRPGMFLLVFPYEAHAVHLCVSKPMKVHKIIYKIDMD